MSVVAVPAGSAFGVAAPGGRTGTVGVHGAKAVNTSQTYNIAPYTGLAKRKNRCTAKNDTCLAFRVKGGELCAGHQRQADKIAARSLPQPAEVVG